MSKLFANLWASLQIFYSNFNARYGRLFNAVILTRSSFGGKRFGLRGADRKRLFAKYALACVQSRVCNFKVRDVGGADVYDVDLGIGNHFVCVCVCTCKAKILTNASGFFRVRGANTAYRSGKLKRGIEVGKRRDAVGVSLAHCAKADYADVQMLFHTILLMFSINI